MAMVVLVNMYAIVNFTKFKSLFLTVTKNSSHIFWLSLITLLQEQSNPPIINIDNLLRTLKITQKNCKFFPPIQ